MNNDFTYNMSEINEEEIMRGWEEMADEADYIPGFDDGEYMEDEDEGYDEDFWEEQYFA
jgi:hypothetical protein